MIKLPIYLVLLSLLGFSTLNSCKDITETASRELYKVAWKQFQNKDYELATLTIDEFIEESLLAKDFNRVGNAHYLKSYISKAQNDPKDQLTEFLITEQFYKKADNSLQLSNINNEIGNLLNEHHAADKSEKYFKLAIDYAENASNDESLGYAMYNLGISYRMQGKADKAIKIFLEALDLEIELERTHQVGKIYLESGVLCFLSKQYDLASEYYGKALQVGVINNHKDIEAFAYNNLGTIRYKNGEIERAADYYNKALVYKENNSLFLATTLNNIGKLHFDKSDYRLATKYFENSIKNQHAIVNVDELITSFEKLQQSLTASGNIDSVFHFTMLQNKLLKHLLKNQQDLADLETSNAIRNIIEENEASIKEDQGFLVLFRNASLMIVFLALFGTGIWKLSAYSNLASTPVSLGQSSIANISDDMIHQEVLSTMTKDKEAILNMKLHSDFLNN